MGGVAGEKGRGRDGSAAIDGVSGDPEAAAAQFPDPASASARAAVRGGVSHQMPAAAISGSLEVIPINADDGNNETTNEAADDAANDATNNYVAEEEPHRANF